MNASTSRWDRFVRVVAVVVFCGALGVFAWIAHEVADADHLPLENRIMQALRHDGAPIGPAGTEAAMRDVTAFGSAIVIGTMTALMLGYLALTHRYRAACLIALATAGGQGVNAGLKHVFARARPDAALRLVEVNSNSFPSGHAMAAATFYLTVGALLAGGARRRSEKIYLLAAALFLAAMTGFSRVYLGVHYPSDVLAGWAAGTAWALACWWIAEWWRRRFCSGGP